MKRYTYVGVDETSLGVGENRVMVVAAYTNDESLTKESRLSKAKDILVEYKAYNRQTGELTYDNCPSFLSPEEMRENGLRDFYWTRARGGRFPIQLVEHLSIAHVVHTNGFKPENTVLFVDSFHNDYDESKYLISESLKSDFSTSVSLVAMWENQAASI